MRAEKASASPLLVSFSNSASERRASLLAGGGATHLVSAEIEAVKPPQR
jgi:hypothetical protein